MNYLNTRLHCAAIALKSLGITLYNFFPFYWAAFIQYGEYMALTCWNLLTHSVRYLLVCYRHHLFIEKYCLNEYHGLADIYGKYISTIGHFTNTNSGDNRDPSAPSFVIGFEGNESRNPAYFPTSAPALELMWKTLDKVLPSYENAMFVDFGCGTGITLLTAMQKPFKSIVGVEIDGQTAILAEKNIKKFMKDQQDEVKCNRVSIRNADMVEYKLPAEAKNSAVVLFMYEPLWTMSKAQAFPIYQKVFQSMAANSGELYVVYFFAGKYTGDATFALKELNWENLVNEKYPSLFFGANEYMMVYRVIKNR
ncbi:class I SAM-dependent methyltransferase [archaeon]|nr:MAG: class I SAM-dependent methyltransferase [archaeon]